VFTGSALAFGTTNSCGCLFRDQLIKRNLKHGRTKSPEYKSWSGAKKRCLDLRCKAYKYYGARGITMCPEWRDSFEAFFRDMGPCPNGRSLDRIDNAKGYEPGNCRWATRIEQANNKRTVRAITYAGETMTISGWARKLGVPSRVLYKRIVLCGWNVQSALTVPLNESRRKFLTLDGVRRSITEWARVTGVRHGTIHYRINMGWSVERALTTPGR
jgi:hypothetical protein